MSDATCLSLDRSGLDALLQAIRAAGYVVIGPRLQDEAICYDEIRSLDDLPAGWTDEQAPGHYRIKRRDDDALFGYNVGPHAWKRFLFPARQRLWRLERDADGGFAPVDEPAPAPRYALLGVRACELAGIHIQDRVFLDQDQPDPVYQARRGDALIISVACTEAGGTCFCTSMGTGPRPGPGYDLALTETSPGERFLLRVGSARGGALVENLALDGVARPAEELEVDQAEELVDICAADMGRELDTDDIRGLLQRNFEHPRWQEVAERCLSCANCTMVCPTCFCSDVEDSSDLSGDIAERWRHWGSCFEGEFSYIHGGAVRDDIASRYRQWATHKLSTWYDQFGVSGCVGCGRCITWCPVGIDITEEAAAIRADDRSAPIRGGP